MGLFTNPLGYAGYPPGAGAPATVVNSTVRAATLTEANAGVRTDIYISPATESASVAVDFASPPVLGFGSTTKRPVHATTLESTLNTDLANTAAATAFGAMNAVFTSGSQTASFFSANSSGGTQTFSALTGTRAGFINLGTGAAAHALALGSSMAVIGFFGATPVVKQLGTTDLRVALINLGLYTTGGATPLNLNGGSFTALQTTVTAPTVAPGASPVVNNAKAGIAAFTDVIANGAYGTLTITNSTVTASSVILITPSCTTANSALSVADYVPGSGTVAIRLFNGGAASTATTINLSYSVLN